MRNVCSDPLWSYGSDHLPVTVFEDEIWQRDAAAGELPVSSCNGMTCHSTFRKLSALTNELCQIFMYIYWLVQTQTLLVFFFVFFSPQLLYTGIVIYAPALILNQGIWVNLWYIYINLAFGLILFPRFNLFKVNLPCLCIHDCVLLSSSQHNKGKYRLSVHSWACELHNMKNECSTHFHFTLCLQEQALSTKAIETGVYYTRQDSRCRLCKDDPVQHIMAGC